MMRGIICCIVLLAIGYNGNAQTCPDVGLGTTSPGSKLEIRGCTNNSNTSSLNVTDSAGASILYIRNDHFIGICNSTPTNTFCVGDTTLQFQLNSTGNLTQIRGVNYSWPSSQGIANSIFENNGAGTLSWTSPWLTTGNSGTTPGTNFLGTPDSIDFIIKTNNTEKMRITAIGLVGIGVSSPKSVLSVGANYSGSVYPEIYGYSSSASNSANGIRGEVATPASSDNRAAGITGRVICGTGKSIGLYGSSYRNSAIASGRAYGIFGYGGNAATGKNYGVYGILQGSHNGAGVYGVDGTGGRSDDSIPGTWAGFFWGRTYMDTLSVDTALQVAKYVLFVKGQMKTTNDSPLKPTTGTWTGYSDERLKKNITTFNGGYNIIKQIEPVKYKYNGIGGLTDDSTHIGVIAQQVQKVMPYCIVPLKIGINNKDVSKFQGTVTKVNDDTYTANVLGFKYDGLVYCMINALKDIANKSDALQMELDKKKAELEAMERNR